MRVIFIVNNQAGNYKGRKVWHKVRSELTITYELYETIHSRYVIDLVKELALCQDQQLIIVIGGDGTIHEAVNGAAGCRHITLAYMKAGSGNDFARAFMYFESARDIERYLQQPIKRYVDCGEIYYNGNETKKFINNFGIGFDAYVSKLTNESKMKKVLNKVGLGKLSYAYFVVQALIQFRPFKLTLELNGQLQTFQNVWFVTVSNQPYFGGGMNLSPTSVVDDAQLEVTVVNQLPRLKFLALFLTVFKAAHTKFKAVTQLQGTDIHFTTDAMLPMHTDGETEMLKQHEVRCVVLENVVTIAK